MVETTIILFLLIWPEGQEQSDPSWYIAPFMTTAECQDHGEKTVADAVKKYGPKVQTKFYCLDRSSRVKE